ncbi:TUBGCP3 [Cordylochernes scorpioides]|uniref:TUBGCP3 n=1 Tax=Cordylochernes scorpioides TaxID=51811 RepID=A0ABY6KDP7_9ARAC|nr:TUBGCP3 [Cordylochernes scorpioides]
MVVVAIPRRILDRNDLRRIGEVANLFSFLLCSVQNVDYDEYVVVEKIKKRLIRDKREKDCLVFGEFHRKLQSSVHSAEPKSSSHVVSSDLHLPRTCGGDQKLEVTEAELVRDVLYAFQGIEGKVVKLEQGTSLVAAHIKRNTSPFVYYSSTNIIIYHTITLFLHISANFGGVQQGSIGGSRKTLVLRLCELGWLYQRVVNWCEARTTDRCLGLVGQSLVAALRDELHQYYQILALMDSQIVQMVHSLDGEGFDDFTDGDIAELMADKELSEDDLVNLVCESESDKSDEEELVPVTFTAKVIREGLALGRKLGNHFMQNDTNVERALRF